MSQQQPIACPATQSQQSPINLKDPIFANFDDGALQIKWDATVQGRLTSDSDSVEISFDFDSRLCVVLDGEVFFLKQFHFHHPSEHAVDGRQLTVELHAVHVHPDNCRIAVVGIFIEPANEQSRKRSRASTRAAASKGSEPPARRSGVSLNPADYLPTNKKHYYRYEGSLTTRPYSENVSWILLRESKRIAKTELNKLIKLGGPARFPQPLNRRFILANFEP